jgi:hypothetical protein
MRTHWSSLTTAASSQTRQAEGICETSTFSSLVEVSHQASRCLLSTKAGPLRSGRFVDRSISTIARVRSHTKRVMSAVFSSKGRTRSLASVVNNPRSSPFHVTPERLVASNAKYYPA